MPKRSWTVSVPPTRSAARARDGQRVALDDQVELARDAAQQRVADGAADHVHARLARDRGEHDRRRPGPRASRIHAVMFH